MSKKDVYQEKGYKDRVDYLKSLAEDYMVDEHMVFTFADMLGPKEDFDGLVTTIEDFCCMGFGG